MGGHDRRIRGEETTEYPPGARMYVSSSRAVGWIITARSPLFNAGPSRSFASRYRTRARALRRDVMGEDPDAPTRPAEKDRSMNQRQRGPMLRKATALDWSATPFDRRLVARHGERAKYAQSANHTRNTRRRRRNFLNLVATPCRPTDTVTAGEYRRW